MQQYESTDKDTKLVLRCNVKTASNVNMQYKYKTFSSATTRNGNSSIKESATFNPIVMSQPAFSYPVIDGNETKQLPV